MSPFARALRLFACAVVSVALAGCGANVLAPSGTVQIDVSASEYALAPTGVVTVPFVVRNLSDRSIDIPQCGPSISVEVERLDGRRWVNYSGTFCLAIHFWGPVALEQGAERAGTSGIHEPGAYRIRLEVEG